MYIALSVIAVYLAVGLFMGELYDHGLRLQGRRITARQWFTALLGWPLGVYFMLRGH